MKETVQTVDARGTAKSNAAEDRVAGLAAMLFEHIEAQINLADTKAQLTLAADTLLAAAITLSDRGTASKLLDSTAAVADRLAACVSILLFVSLILSICLALLAARPTLRPPERSRNLFYFGDIVRLRKQEFTRAFLGQSDSDVTESILAQVYAKAEIATYKFSTIQRSIELLLVALILWGALQVI